MTTDENKNSRSSRSSRSASPEPSHVMTGSYALLMETNGAEYESWYYFIRKEGNEEALQHLQNQLDKVEWTIVDDMSTFDLDLKYSVSATTAKEMTKIDLNSCSFHRKFDGKLEKIDFKFSKKDLKNNERMICKVFDLLGYGQIEDYIDDEDLDPEDLATESDSSSEESDSTEDDSTEDEKLNQSHQTEVKLPPVLASNNAPNWVRAKQKKHKKKNK